MGHVFDNLTKAGVSQNGKSTYYDTPAEAAQAIATKSAPLAQPDNYTFGGSVPSLPTPLVARETPGGGADASPSIAPPGPITATRDVSSIMPGSIPHSAPVTPETPLTTKGAILKTVLQTLVGAAAGYGARSGGEAVSNALGAVNSIDEQQRKKRVEALDEQLKQAQIANLPILYQKNAAEVRRLQTQADENTASANRKGIMYSKGGLVRIGPHDEGDIIEGTQPPEKQTPQQQREQYVKDHPDQFTNDQDKADYVKFGTRPKPAPTARATPPNNAGKNAADKFKRDKEFQGNAQTFASKAMKKAGNDPAKALQIIDSFVSQGNLSAEQAAIAAEARKQLQRQIPRATSKKSGPPTPEDIAAQYGVTLPN